MHLRLAAALVFVLVASLASAQATSLGVTASGAAIGNHSAVAYDDKHEVFLQVWEHSAGIVGRFIHLDGTPAGITFSVQAGTMNDAVTPKVTYSRRSIDDVFFVTFSARAAVGSMRTLFVQRMRYTGSGATAGEWLGSTSAVSPSALSQDAHDVVFNPITRQFLVAWNDMGTGGALSVRLFDAGGVAQAATRPLGAAEHAVVLAAFDWRQNQFAVATTHFVSFGSCSYVTTQNYVLDAAGEPAGPMIERNVGSFHVPIDGKVALGFSPEFGFIEMWATIQGCAGNSLGSLARGRFTGEPVTWDTGTQRNYRPSFDYDAWCRCEFLVSEGNGAMSGHLVGGFSGAAGAQFDVSTAAGSRRAMVRSSRDGEYVVSYITNAGAVLHRFSVPTSSTPGLRYSSALAYMNAHGATSGAALRVEGWAADLGASIGSGVDAVHVWAFPATGANPIFLGADTTFYSRPDVSAIFGNHFVQSGFRVSTTSLPIGTYTLAAYPHLSATGAFAAPAVSTITIASEPFTAIDTPTSGATLGASFSVVGWAVDRGAATGTGVDAVHAYAYPWVNGALGSPTFLGIAAHGQSRPDVGAGLGDSRFNTAGYSLGPISPNLPPGTYRIVVYARSALTGIFGQASFVDVTVPIR